MQNTAPGSRTRRLSRRARNPQRLLSRWISPTKRPLWRPSMPDSIWVRLRRRRDRPGGESGIELAGKTKEELLSIFSKMIEERPIQTLRKEVEALKIAFYKLRRAEVEAARRHSSRRAELPRSSRRRPIRPRRASRSSSRSIAAAGTNSSLPGGDQGGEPQDQVADYRGAEGARLFGRDAQPDLYQVPRAATAGRRRESFPNSM